MAPKKVRVRRGGGFPASHHFFTRERPRCDGSVPRPSATSNDPHRGRRPGIRPRERDERSPDDGHGRSRRSEHLEAARNARGAREPATSPRRSTARTATNNRARFGGRVRITHHQRPSASHRLTVSSPLHSTRRRARVLSVVLATTPTRLRTPIPRRRHSEAGWRGEEEEEGRFEKERAARDGRVRRARARHRAAGEPARVDGEGAGRGGDEAAHREQPERAREPGEVRRKGTRVQV